MAIGEELGLQVNAKGAGKGKVSCVVVQPDGSEVEAEVVENQDGTFDIFYTAPAPGNYVIYVRFGGENIPRSPFKVMVSQQVLGLGPSRRRQKVEFRLCFSSVGFVWRFGENTKRGPSALCSRCFDQPGRRNRRPCAITPGSNPARVVLIFPH